MDETPAQGPYDTVGMRGGGLATSGTTARRWRRGGHDLHHIVDPRTGLPVRSPWRTVSVAAATCADANAASTAALVKGAGAERWLTRRGLPARLVAQNGLVVTTPGWPTASARPGSTPSGGDRGRGPSGRPHRPPGGSRMTSETLWYANRATGAVCLVLFTVVVLLGIAVRLRTRIPGLPRFGTMSLHRTLSLSATAFLALHITTAIVDSYVDITVVDVVVPFASDYQPLWLGLGTVALDLMLAVLVTSLLRERLGHRTWRAVHWLAYASWPVALLHGIGIGTDTGADWMTWLTVACVATVVAAFAARLARAAHAARHTPVALLRTAEGTRP